MQPGRTTVEHLSASSDEWFDIANSVEVVLDRASPASRLDIVRQLQVAGHNDWTVLPGGEPGDCRRFLLAMIDGGHSVNASEHTVKAAIQRRLDQVRIYLKRIGPDMEGVVLYVDRSHFMWRGGLKSPAYQIWCEAWCRFRAILKETRPQMNVRIVFARPESSEFDICHFGIDGAPVGGRRLLNWWRDASINHRHQFRERILLARRLGVMVDFECSYIHESSASFDVRRPWCPVLEFGRSSQRPGDTDIQRVRLHLDPGQDMPFVFDGQKYNWEHRMDIHLVERGDEDEQFVWRPADMSLFSLDPSLWLVRSGALV